MLLELSVRDFAIIDQTRLELAGGFNVLTGETGAGKSILVDAVALLLGGRADTGAVRAEAERATIQGVLDPGIHAPRITAVLEAHGVPPEDQLILGRDVYAAGRSIARLNSQVVPARVLAEVTRYLVGLHGQSDAASLKREAEHIRLLDRHAGIEADRQGVTALVEALDETRRDLVVLANDEAALARRADMLAYQVREIEAVAATADEEAELLAERTRLANAEGLAALADGAYTALRGDVDDQAGAVDLAETAAAAMAELAEIDSELAPKGEAATGAAVALAEVAAAVRDYRDRVEFNPERLVEVEDRLAAIADLKRKYGATLDEVHAWAATAAAELESLVRSEDRAEELRRRQTELLAELATAAGRLSEARQAAASELAAAVEAEMSELGMPGGVFQVAVDQRRDEAGVEVSGTRYAFDRYGIDRVRFLVTTNPGEPPRPLAKTASGGETARLMLAIKAVLGVADGVPTLVFDEIDAGIGGRVGAVVGRKLWRLSRSHQVLCVTHLPQVAAFADAHYRVEKTVAGGRTVTSVARLRGADRVRELVAMLGSETRAGQESAEELLATAKEWRRQEVAGL